MISDGAEYHQSDAPRTCRPLPVGMLPITCRRMRVNFWNLSQKRCLAVLSRYWCVDRGFQRLSICLWLYIFVKYSAITIPILYVSSAHPTATLHHIFNSLYDIRLDKLCNSMSRRSWITHLVSKEVHSIKEDAQLPNSPPVLLFPHNSHALDIQLYSLAIPSLQHQNSVGTSGYKLDRLHCLVFLLSPLNSWTWCVKLSDFYL